MANLISVLRASVILVCVLSSMEHLANPYRFVGHIANYELTSPNVTILLAVFIPVFQLLFSMGMLFNSTVRASGWFLVGLFSTFLFAQLSTLLRGKSVSCGCFGEYSMEIGPLSIAVAFALVLCTAFISIFGDFANSRAKEGVQSDELAA